MKKKKRLIFVVDDDSRMRNSLGKYLGHRDFEVKAIDDGFGVLLLLEYIIPDLIISDIRMPKLDGISLLQGLKNCEETKDIPVVFMSAYREEEILNQAKELGARYFLIKPSPISSIDDLIKKIF